MIVTGAAAGFGAAIARGFAAEGARVMVADIDGDAAEALAKELDVALAFQIDVLDENRTAEMAQAAVDAWGGICLLYTSPSPRDATLSRMPSSA